MLKLRQPIGHDTVDGSIGNSLAGEVATSTLVAGKLKTAHDGAIGSRPGHAPTPPGREGGRHRCGRCRPLWAEGATPEPGAPGAAVKLIMGREASKGVHPLALAARDRGVGAV